MAGKSYLHVMFFLFSSLKYPQKVKLNYIHQTDFVPEACSITIHSATVCLCVCEK